MTLDDRYLWVINNIDYIKEVSSMKRIEKDAEKPYSFLACCMEIAGYLTAKQRGIPYLSGFPVPIDGSNNG
jgi:DNA-directed RNA polymerase